MKLLLLTLTVSSFLLLSDACCPFPAFSFSAVTSVTKEDFKCSESITVTCSYEDETAKVGIAANVTDEEGTKPNVLKRGSSPVKVTLTCDKASKLWKVDKSSKKYSNVACVMSNTGSVWVLY
ncbi:hypothetical protein L5515_004918 [Caenorhabditis briggsae]|uniref:Uncharacterized protein n=1 Tax=Caenorhabditis briggsae TaxID=6238 RepID=A0AAE9JCJ1_CAEBR|nr:hypothetical protein L5515_004918 [Caenorhabditis briggsae]